MDRDYFETVIRPRLAHPLVSFVGEIDDDERFAFLRGARALLFPIDWPEPFGLVMIEAMACGTPVISRPRGAVPEVVRHGRTGFVVESVGEMVAAARCADTLDRGECRRHVEQSFRVERMVDDYQRAYRRQVTRAAAA